MKRIFRTKNELKATAEKTGGPAAITAQVFWLSHTLEAPASAVCSRPEPYPIRGSVRGSVGKHTPKKRERTT